MTKVWGPRDIASRARYLRRSVGLWGLFRRLVAKSIAPIYDRYDFYVANTYLENVALPVESESGPGAIRGRAVTSPEEFDALAAKLHPSFSAEALRAFLAASPKRFLLLAEHEKSGGDVEYVGYRSCEQGIFHVSNARQRGELPDRYAMVYHNEVAPAFRGHGVTQRTRAGFYTHCRRIGVDRLTAVIPVHNAASQRAHSKTSHGNVTTLTGPITCVMWFRGLIVRKTPWKDVLQLIEIPPPVAGRS